MRLTDKNGNEWEFSIHDEADMFGALIPVKKKPEVIDWSKVHPDVPVEFFASHGHYKSLGFLNKVEKTSAGSMYFPVYEGPFQSRASLVTGKWVAWFGGDCPLPDGVLVNVIQRSGVMDCGPAKGFEWENFSIADPADIIAFYVTGLAKGYYYSEDEAKRPQV